MSLKARINGFTSWVNLRLGQPKSLLNDVLVDLMMGLNMKNLVEGLTGCNFPRLDSYDGLTQVQKVTRAEWIEGELKRWNKLPADYKMDSALFAARNADQVFDFLWILVQHDIYFIWEICDYLQNLDLHVITKYPFTWIPEKVPDGPKKRYKVKENLIAGFGASAVEYEELPPDPNEYNPMDDYIPFPYLNAMKEYSSSEKSFDKSLKPQKIILSLVQHHLRMTKTGRSLVVMCLEDLCDIRVLCALVNSFIPDSFTPQVLLNDRWSINLIMRCIEDVFHMSSSFDASDFLQGDVRGTCAYFCSFFMAGYKFRQHKCAVDHYNELRFKKRDINLDLEDYLENSDNLTIEERANKRIMEAELKTIDAKIVTLKETFDFPFCQSWLRHSQNILSNVINTLKEMLKKKFDPVEVPRSMTISHLCISMLVNLTLTHGVGFYLLTSIESLTKERRIILCDKQTGDYLHDLHRRIHKNFIRKRLKLPVDETVDINPETYPQYDVYIEAVSRNKTLSTDQKLLRQVFPSSTLVWQKALQLGARDGDIATVRSLLNFFTQEPNFINCSERGSRNRALHLAAFNGHFYMTELLLEYGADFDAKNAAKQTPLFCAIEGGYRDVAHLLIEWGCDVHWRNQKGVSAFDICPNDNLKSFLIEQYEYYSEMIPKVMDRDLPCLNHMVLSHKDNTRRLANLRSRCVNGSTLMHTAAYFGYRPVVKELLRMRLDINLRDYKGATPLHRAREVSMIKLLIDNEADINFPDFDGNMPLHVKCYGENGEASELDAVEMLLDREANISAVNFRGLMPIHCAAMQGRIDVIQMLLKYEQEQGNCVTERILAESDNPQPPSLVYLSLANGSSDCAAWLLDQGFTFKQNEPDYLLHRIVTHQLSVTNRLEVVEFLLVKGGANPNMRYTEEGGNTPLHYVASLSDFSDILITLVDFDADVDAVNNEHCTALFAACQSNNTLGASLLGEFGANIRVKNNHGLTALDYIPDYDEWINSGYFDNDMLARIKAYKLKHTRDFVRAMSKKIKPPSSIEKTNILDVIEKSINLVVEPGSQKELYYRPSTTKSRLSALLPPLSAKSVKK